MKTLAHMIGLGMIAIGVVVVGATVILCINWDINHRLKLDMAGSHCPVWLMDSPQEGCHDR